MNIVAEPSVTLTHKGIKEIPSQAYLRECFDYKDGWLYWKRRPVEHFVSPDACNKWGNKMAGKRAGHISSDGKYIKVTIGKTDFYAHRVIWKWHHGEISSMMELDHKDINGLNNRIENLRIATCSQNMMNRTRGKKKSSLPKGVVLDRKLFRARVVVNRKIIFQQWFTTPEEASKAYNDAAESFHGEFAKFDHPQQLEGGHDLLSLRD